MSVGRFPSDASKRKGEETMKGFCSVVIVLFACGMMFGVAEGALTTNEWQAVNGVWDGNWNDVDHWTRGVVPNTPAQYVRFQGTSGTSYTVSVDEDYSVAGCELVSVNMDTWTTFRGTGSITTAANVVLYNYRDTILDGVSMSAGGDFIIYKDMIVTNGASIKAESFQAYAASPKFYLYDGCSLKAKTCRARAPLSVYVNPGAIVDVDEVTRYSKNYLSSCHFYLWGGDVNVDMFSSFAAGSGATVESGTLTIGKIACSAYGCTFNLKGGMTFLGSDDSASAAYPLRPEWVTVGADATLDFTVGKAYLLCKDGSISPSAKISAVIPEGLESGGYMVLRGWRDDTLTVGQREAVTLKGDTEGWFVNADAGGHVVVCKRGAVGVKGSGTCYEWTGAENGNFISANNWSNGTGVPSEYPHDSVGICFAASGESTISYDASCTLASFTFLEAMVDSYNFRAPKALNGGGLTLANYYLYSKSALPQHLFATIRSARAGNVGARADGPGALFLTPASSTSESNPLPFYTKSYSASVTPEIRGDVRLGGRTAANGVCGIALKSKEGSAPFTRLTVVEGATLTYANASAAGFAVQGASIDVEANAKLTYANTALSYQWTAEPSDFRINGTFDIQAPFVGGFNQTYGGSGVLKTAEIRPSELGNTVLSLRDTLTLEPSQDWTTASGSTPQNSMSLSVAAGDPTIRLSADWTYGPGQGETQTRPVDRSLIFSYGTSLTVDAGGHRGTFKDYLTGRGTLIVTNGVVKFDYGERARMNIRICNTGVFEWTDENTLASLTVMPGGVLRPLAAVPLNFTTTQGDATVTLTGAVLDVDRSLVPAAGWLTVLRAAKGITGVPTMIDEDLVCRVRMVDGNSELQVKEKAGLLLIFH